MMDRRGSSNRRRPAAASSQRTLVVTVGMAALAFGIVLVLSFFVSKQNGSSHTSSSIGSSFSSFHLSTSGSSATSTNAHKVFSAYSEQSTAAKQRQDLAASPLVEHIVLNAKEQVEFLTSHHCTDGAVKRFQELPTHLAQELWKYCALYTFGGMYLDAESPLMIPVDQLFSRTQNNVAVLADRVLTKSMHGSLLYLAQPQSSIAESMIEVLLTTSTSVLEASPLLLPRTLHDLIANQVHMASLYAGSVSENWFLLQHTCHVDPLRRTQVTAGISAYALNSYRLTQNCPEPNGFCCSVSDTVEHVPVLMTKHLLLPYQLVPPASKLPKPYNAEAGHYEEEDLPYISIVTEKIHAHPQETLLTPNFFDILLQNDCLPSDKKCSDCLRNKQGSDCKKCATECKCYCKTLCHVPIEEKFISKDLTVTPPLYARDPSRIVPRIVHQTWFEDVDPDKYPNMSRLIESFKQSGWEYKFYTDDAAGNFLSTHFPAEVRQAYDAIRPGAFKADLFRYCALLIHGGLYADMDIMLEANLDLAVAPDVGFMVPQDEPGTSHDHRMCLWNGFIAAAPGHPFLAKAIETVVNNIRNRFTSVDTDNMFCPDPELSVLHAFDTLFTAGPCILGAMVNKVLGRKGQTSFVAGEIDPFEATKRQALEKGTEFIIGLDGTDVKPSKKIPGRTIILHQDKWDMGAHRFTFLEKNLVVAATDLPDSDDRDKQVKPPAEHYSKTHVKTGVYGVDKLYVDNNKANEELRFYVNVEGSNKRYASASDAM